MGLVAFVLAATAGGAPAAAHADTAVAGGPSNIVLVQNHDDGSLRVRGLVQLGRVSGPTVAPQNFAAAINTCTASCDTLAVALQVNLVNPSSTVFAPQNVAVATNGGCTGCVAEAVALQYNIGVDDPTVIPPRVDQLVAAMKAELAQVSASSGSLADAETGVLAVIAQFQDLAGSLMTSRDVEAVPAAAPPEAAAPAIVTPATAAPSTTSATAPSTTSATGASPASAAPAPTPDPSPTAQPSPDATPSVSPEPSPSPA